MRTLEELRDKAHATRFSHRIGPGRVDPFAVLRAEGVRVLRFPFGFDALDGLYVPYEDMAAAMVNVSHRVARQRFTAAHELGHHLLGRTPSVDETGRAEPIAEWVPGRQPMSHEEEVNRFAGYFLIDQVALELEAARWPTPLDRVLGVMSTFTVSAPVAARRLAMAGLVTPDDAARAEKIDRIGERLRDAGLDASGLDFDTRKDFGPGYQADADWLLGVGIMTGEQHRALFTLTPIPVPRGPAQWPDDNGLEGDVDLEELGRALAADD